ncbi:tetratricopeptide repeat protein [Singulisphaera rosea]
MLKSIPARYWVLAVVALAWSPLSASAADATKDASVNGVGAASASKNWRVASINGGTAWAEGRLPEAEVFLRQAVAEAQRLGPETLDLAEALGGLSTFLASRDQGTEAYSLASRALEIREKRSGAEHPNVAEGLSVLGRVCLTTKEYSKAETLLTRALSIREKALGADHLDVATNLCELALLDMIRGQFSLLETSSKPSSTVTSGEKRAKVCFHEAEFRLVRALAIRETALGAEDKATLEALTELASCYLLEGDIANASPLLRRALSLREKTLGPDHADVAEMLVLIAMSSMEERKYREAEPLLKRAVEIQKGVEDANKPGTKEALERYDDLPGQALRSAEVMANPDMMPTEADLEYLNGLEFRFPDSNVGELFDKTCFNAVDKTFDDVGMAHLRRLINLETVSIWSDQVTDAGLLHLENLVAVKELTLMSRRINGSGLIHLKAMGRLKDLNLATAQIDDDGLSCLPPLPSLEALDLSHTNVSDVGTISLERYTRLKRLDLTDTKVSDEGVSRLKEALPELEIRHSSPSRNPSLPSRSVGQAEPEIWRYESILFPSPSSVMSPGRIFQGSGNPIK